MIYEVYMADPRKGLVSRAPHFRDTSFKATRDELILRAKEAGKHPIVRCIPDTELEYKNGTPKYCIQFIVNAKALQDLEKEDE